MKRRTQLKPLVLGAGLCLLLSTPVVSFANDVTVGRYLTVAVKPQAAQTQLLQQRIQVRFPQNVLTLHDAMEFLLQFSGYRLAPLDAMPNAVKAMLTQPLPEIDRNFGPMTLQQGVTTLAGKPFYVLVDPVHRLINFKLKRVYRSLYSAPLNSFNKTKEELNDSEYYHE